MKQIIFTSDYSNDNKLSIIQRDVGDIIISIYIGDKTELGVHFATSQGGTRLHKMGIKQ